MSMTDPVADFLTRLRNGATAQKGVVPIPSSRLKKEMARILKEQGYIEDYSIEEPTAEQPAEIINVQLKYAEDRSAVILGLQRVSRPGRRHYVSHNDIPRVQGGMGPAILPGADVVLWGHASRGEGVGGEVVASVW